MNEEERNMRWAAVRIGDMTAFEELCTEQKTPVYTIMVRMTGNKRINTIPPRTSKFPWDFSYP